MGNNFYRNFHIYLSLLCFLACFLFPAFYIRETRESIYPASLLASGWLGPIEGYFSWYANPFYLLALIFYKKNSSPMLAFLALLLSLSFLLQKELIMSEAPTYAEIKSYGIGYFLWVTSIGILFTGQAIVLAGGSHKYSIIFTSMVAIASSYIFINHFVFSDNSQFKIIQARNSIFETQCKKSVTKIYAKLENVEGVYFEPDFEIRFRKETSGGWRIEGTGVAALGELNSGNIRYYEKLNDGYRPDHATNKYVRYFLNDHTGEPVDRMDSEVSVKVTKHKFEEMVNILSETLTIIDNKRNRLLAETTYTFDPEKNALCSDSAVGSNYSSHDFLRVVLNFNRKYDSIYSK